MGWPVKGGPRVRVHVHLRLQGGGGAGMLASFGSVRGRSLRVGVVGRRAGSGDGPGQGGPGWVAVACCGDGYTHLVSEELIGRDLARSGRVIARCGHVVTAASLTEALRPSCALCGVRGEN
jgi:hypothetical protein